MRIKVFTTLKIELRSVNFESRKNSNFTLSENSSMLLSNNQSFFIRSLLSYQKHAHNGNITFDTNISGEMLFGLLIVHFIF